MITPIFFRLGRCLGLKSRQDARIAAAALCLSACSVASASDQPAATLRDQPVVTLSEQQTDSLAHSFKAVDLDGDRFRGYGQAYRDSIQRIVDMFYYDQFRHFQDPAAPYFLFMSKDASLAMGIGGCVRMRGYYDWDGAIPASGFAPYLIPMNPDPAHDRNFGTTPAGSTLFFRVIGRNKSLGDYQLYIEANFNGYQGRDFHLKKAYAVINDFTIGYANSSFSDPGALPPTVDAQGPANKMSPTSVLVRWMKSLDRRSRWTLALSAETPSTSIAATDGVTRKCDDWLPDLAGFIQYQWSRSQHVRLAGVLRTLTYLDCATERRHSKLGFGLMATTVFSPHPSWTLYGGINGGRGFESLGSDLMIGSYDLVPVADDPSRMYTPWGMGWHVAVQYNFRPNIFASAGWSQARYMPRAGVSPDEYKWGNVFAVNAFWNLTARIQTGVEFDLGSRRNMDGRQRWARRVGLMCQFSF